TSGARSLLCATQRCPSMLAGGRATMSEHAPSPPSRLASSSTDAAKTRIRSAPAASATASSSSTSHGSSRAVTSWYGCAPASSSAVTAAAVRATAAALALPIWAPISAWVPAARTNGSGSGGIAPLEHGPDGGALAKHVQRRQPHVGHVPVPDQHRRRAAEALSTQRGGRERGRHREEEDRARLPRHEDRPELCPGDVHEVHRDVGLAPR